MRTPRSLMTALALAAALGLSACATPPSPTQPIAEASAMTPQARSTLESRVAAFQSVINRGDWGQVMDFTPPGILRQMEEETGVPVEVIRAMASGIVKGVTEEINIGGRLYLDKASVGTARDGTPYVLIPTTSQIAAKRGGESLSTTGISLAMLDGGQWYLMRLDAEGEGARRLQAAYPQFKGIGLPRPAETLQPN